jgi:histidinol dehydrogenase
MLKIVAFQDRHTQLDKIFNRSTAFDPELVQQVREILAIVASEGDVGVLRLTEKYDGTKPDTLRVPEDALELAYRQVDARLLQVFRESADNIRRFHEKQVRQSWFTDDGDGVVLGQRVLALDRVGLYVPGGEAFYPSSLLMNAIPAQVAGVSDLVVVSPPSPETAGLPHPLVLAASHLLGIRDVYAAGGAQAIGALAYGTESIERVDKIVGPGNRYVATAKRLVYGPVDIDSFAGPSEIVVLADESASPVFVAADLLSQAEHDVCASAVLVTPSRELANSVRDQIADWWPELDRKDILRHSLENYSASIVTSSLDEAVDVVNEIAPEHLEIVTESPWETMTNIRHAGAIFLGQFASEPVGDYLAGPNHVLPTSGTARFASALGVEDFIKRQSIISYTSKRLRQTGPSIIHFAESEKLTAHARAIRVRLDALSERSDQKGEGASS